MFPKHTRPDHLADQVLHSNSSVEVHQGFLPSRTRRIPIPGCRESEEGDSSLSAVLDSLIPYLRDSNPPAQLPTFFGNAIIDPPLSLVIIA
jgi:hypothetical protein